jgi:hypothetical protein
VEGGGRGSQRSWALGTGGVLTLALASDGRASLGLRRKLRAGQDHKPAPHSPVLWPSFKGPTSSAKSSAPIGDPFSRSALKRKSGHETSLAPLAPPLLRHLVSSARQCLSPNPIPLVLSVSSHPLIHLSSVLSARPIPSHPSTTSTKTTDNIDNIDESEWAELTL